MWININYTFSLNFSEDDYLKQKYNIILPDFISRLKYMKTIILRLGNK